jgi:hypothetical protein
MKGRLTPVRLELAASKIGLASEPNFFDDYIPRVAAGRRTIQARSMKSL